MRRYSWILAVVFILFSLTGCHNKSENYKAPANFYYKSSTVSFFEPDSIITPEIRETSKHNGNIIDILNDYFQGPVSDKLISPFPTNLRAIEVTTNNSSAIISLNEEFSSMTGLDVTIACSCICSTITDLTGCESVEIHVENQDGVTLQSWIFSNGDLLFLDSLPET